MTLDVEQAVLGGETSPGPGVTRRQWRALSRVLVLYAISFAVALGIAALLVVVVGGAPLAVVTSLYQGSLGSGQALGQTIATTSPILLIGTGALIAVRAGMFNIGQQGQLEIGVIVGALVALKMPGPGPVVLIVALVGSAAGGALWAGLSAAMRFVGRVDVVISSLLLIYIADQVLAFVLSSPSWLQQPGVNGQPGNAAVSPLLPSSVRLPTIWTVGGVAIGLGAVLAVGVFLVVWAMLERGRWGRRIRITGLSSTVARRMGLRVAFIAGGALVLSGALAGLGGGVMLTGTAYQVSLGFAGNIPTDGLLAALVIFDRPAYLVPVAFFFGIIESGGGFLISTGVPSYFAQILEGLLVLAAIFPPVYEQRHRWAYRIRAARTSRRQERVGAVL